LNTKQRQIAMQTRTLHFYSDDIENDEDEVAAQWRLLSGMRPAQVTGLLNLQRRT